MLKLVAIFAFSLLAAGCSAGDDEFPTIEILHSTGPSSVETPAKSAIDTLAIRPTFTHIVGIGETLQFAVDIWLTDGDVVEDVRKDFTDSDDELHTIAWDTKNFGVAVVDENGLVTAVSAGETFITATADGHETEARVIVEAELSMDPNIDVNDLP